MAEFSCRTKVISGTEYKIKTYLVSDNSLRSIASCGYSKEAEAQAHIDRMKERLGDKYRFEILPCPWTEEICIECGREVW